MTQLTEQTEQDNQFTGACIEGNLDTVKELIAKGQDPRVDNNWGLRWACEYGRLPVVKYLCETFKPGTFGGVDPTAGDNYALRYASQNGHLDVVKYLCKTFPPGTKYGMDPNDCGNYAVCWAKTDEIRDYYLKSVVSKNTNEPVNVTKEDVIKSLETVMNYIKELN